MSLNHLAVCVFVNDVNMFSPSHVKICLFVLSAFLSGNGKLGEEAEKSFRFVLSPAKRLLHNGKDVARVPCPSLSPLLAKTCALNCYSRACYLGCTVFGTIPMIKSAQ